MLLRVIWQYMDRSIYYHMTLSAMNYLLFNIDAEVKNHSGGAMVSMLTSSAVDRGFEPRSNQTEDYKIGICCFSAKHAALRRKSKDRLAQNQNVSEWGDMSDMSIRGELFQ